MAGYEQYIPPGLRGPLRDIFGMARVTGEGAAGLLRAVQQDPLAVNQAIGESMIGGAQSLVNDPVGTVRGVVSDTASTVQRALTNTAADYLPEGVTLANATPDQIKAANDARYADLASTAAMAVPGTKALRAGARAAGDVDVSGLAADATYAGRSIAQGDPRGLIEAFQRGGEGESLSAARGPNKRDLDPYFYQDTKMDDYLSNTQVDSVDLGENLSRVPRSWEEMENKLILPLYGDRTSRGRLVKGVDGITFANPVYTEGGVDFMRGPAAQQDRSVWASNSNIIKRIADEAESARLLSEGEDVYGMTGSMAPNANDFATMTGAAMAELVKGSKFTKKTAKEFDEAMKAFDPNFVGLNSPDLTEWAVSTSSPNRKMFIRLMDTSPMQAAGLPSPAKARLSVTDPTQVDMPAGMFGLGVSKLDELSPILRKEPAPGSSNAPIQSVPHSTYNTQITGDYFGSLPPVPQGLIFRDVYDPMEGGVTKAGKPLNEAHKTHAIKTIMPVQRLRPDILEGILDYIAKSGR